MDPGNLAKLKLHRLIHCLRRIDRWKKEHQETAIQTQNRRGAMADILRQERSMADRDGDLEVP
jgi:cell wall assembly regulator SMI1